MLPYAICRTSHGHLRRSRQKFRHFFNDLTEARWGELVELATDKRAAPLLDRSIQHAKSAHLVPTECSAMIADATALGLERSLQLVAALALNYGATWVPAALAETCGNMADHIDVAEEAILRKGRQSGWRAAIPAALTPNPLRLAGMLQLQGNNPIRWLAYPAWLVQRGAALSRRAPGKNHHQKHHARSRYAKLAQTRLSWPCRPYGPTPQAHRGPCAQSGLPEGKDHIVWKSDGAGRSLEGTALQRVSLLFRESAGKLC